MSKDANVRLQVNMKTAMRQLAAVREAMPRIRTELALMDATWEPIDWSDFGKPLGGLDFQ